MFVLDFFALDRLVFALRLHILASFRIVCRAYSLCFVFKVSKYVYALRDALN